MDKWNNACRFIAFFILVFGVATFSQNIFDYNLGIDQLLITDLDAIKNGTPYPSRPYPTTASVSAYMALRY